MTVLGLITPGAELHMTTKTKGMAGLKPVETSNLHSKVYSQLRSGLMAGKFRPGETLTLRTLAAALGTSVMPARDAVLRLSGERALERSGRSVRVPVLDQEQFEDVQRFRIALEGEACMLAAVRITPVELAAIEQAHERVERTCSGGNLEKFLAANQEFHFAIYRAAHNPLLQSLIETLWLQAGPYLAKLAEGSTPRVCRAIDLAAHSRLVAALKKNDPEGARAALQADLSDRDELFSTLNLPVIEEPRARRARFS